MSHEFTASCVQNVTGQRGLVLGKPGTRVWLGFAGRQLQPYGNCCCIHGKCQGQACVALGRSSDSRVTTCAPYTRGRRCEGGYDQLTPCLPFCMSQGTLSTCTQLVTERRREEPLHSSGGRARVSISDFRVHRS